MTALKKIFVPLYWIVVAALFAGMIVRVAYFTPDEETMGAVQKIFYLHLPTAINTFLACLVVFIASIGYLWQRSSWWDDLGAAAAKVAVLFGGVVLLTGMIWARSAWGHWWLWTPRLTFSLVLWLLYVVYLTTRTSIESSERRAVVSAVYGIIAFLDVPLVYLSVRLMKDMHPVSVDMAGEMKLTLGLFFIPVTMLAAGLIVTTFGMNRRLRKFGEESRQWAAPVPMVKGLKGATV